MSYYDLNTLARNVGCTQTYKYEGNEWWTNYPYETCFSDEQLQKFVHGIANKLIDMIEQQQDRNPDGELYDTEINATLQFLINAVKEEFYGE